MKLRTLLTLCALALAARAAETAPPKSAPAGAGGDGRARAQTASMVIEAEEDEAPPPIPRGDERRAIGDYIRDNSSAIRDCYQKRLQERPTLQGKLVARFDIGPAGRVIGATADGIGDRELILCVVQAVRKWQFGKPASGGKIRVAYPFKFQPQPSR